MGLFNLFDKKKNLPAVKDLVWKNQAGKYNGCENFIQKYPDSIWICWFMETQNSFNHFLAEKNMNQLDIKLARTVQPFMVADKSVFFLEHYPLSEQEETLIQSWNAKEILVFNALDEPLFKQFGGDRIISLMEKMGMKEDEFIEHSMISKSIKQAQTKLQQKVSFESTANSQEDWFKVNIGSAI